MILATTVKILIAVVTCHKRRINADSQRATWASSTKNADVRFFVGNGIGGDGIQLDVADDYYSLPHKVRAVYSWALQNNYDYVFKTDDDVYIEPTRLLHSRSNHDYIGRPSCGPSKIPYASGFSYWVSKHAMKVLVETPIDDWAEDRWVGKSLFSAGICLHPDDRYHIIESLTPENLVTGSEGPLLSNNVITACELIPEKMKQIHNCWLESVK